MAKKSRKPNLPQETLERARRELERSGLVFPEQPAPDRSATSPQAAAPQAEARVLPTRRPLTTGAELRAHYAYVVTDLENMAMLAAGILIILVVLSFII